MSRAKARSKVRDRSEFECDGFIVGVVIELSVSRKVPTEETRKLECDAAKFGVFLRSASRALRSFPMNFSRPSSLKFESYLQT